MNEEWKEQGEENQGEAAAEPNFILKDSPTVSSQSMNHTINDGMVNDDVAHNDIENNQSSAKAPVTDNIKSHAQPSPYVFWSEQAGDTQQVPPYTQPGFYQPTMNGASPQPEQPKEKKECPKAVRWIIKAAVFGLVAGVGFLGVQYGAEKLGLVHNGNSIISEKGLNSNGGSDHIATTIVSGNKTSIPTDVSRVVDNAMPSIVSITSTVTQTYNYWGQDYSQDSTGSGSGIIIDQTSDQLLIATNNHVISGAKYITVGFHGADDEKERVKATVKGKDSSSDLAVISVKISDIKSDILKKIKPAALGNSKDVKVGEMAIAIGNSMGYGQSLTVGYISAKDRKVKVEDTAMTLLQTDAAINPGNSGGALLNAKGEVIGINSVKYSDTSVEGMGFAIPISKATPIINELKEKEELSNEEKGYLGIKGGNITEDTQQQYLNMPLGVYVSEVSEDGAAKAAGVVQGDIIVGANDKELTTIEALSEYINSFRAGTKVTLKIKRYEKGQYVDKSIEVTLKGQSTLDSLSGSDGSTSNNGNSSNGNNGGNSNGKGSNGGNSNGNSGQQQMPSDDEMKEFFEYFNQYYGN